MTASSAWSQAEPDDLVLVEGGPFQDQRSNYFQRTLIDTPFIGRLVTIASFYIGRHEVTQKEWVQVMGGNPSQFRGDDLPVEMVSWYDCIEYCNKRSLQEGLAPCYIVNKDRKDPNNGNEIDDVKWTVTINPGANGYRLPTEAEWEYAADGGQRSRSYAYSGGDDLDQVAWFWQNSGDTRLVGVWSWPVVERNHDRTKPVGTKAPNELGLYDMSGNVREWCWNWYEKTASVETEPAASAAGRVWRGGGWLGGDFCCAPSFRAGFEASGRGPDQGFRICRDQ